MPINLSPLATIRRRRGVESWICSVWSIVIASRVNLSRPKQPGVDFPLTAQSPGCVRTKPGQKNNKASIIRCHGSWRSWGEIQQSFPQGDKIWVPWIFDSLLCDWAGSKSIIWCHGSWDSWRGWNVRFHKSPVLFKSTVRLLDRHNQIDVQYFLQIKNDCLVKSSAFVLANGQPPLHHNSAERWRKDWQSGPNNTLTPFLGDEMIDSVW